MNKLSDHEIKIKQNFTNILGMVIKQGTDSVIIFYTTEVTLSRDLEIERAIVDLGTSMCLSKQTMRVKKKIT